MCVFVYVCVCVCVYVRAHAHTHRCAPAHERVCVNLCMLSGCGMCLLMCTYLYLHIYISVNMYMPTCMHTSMCACACTQQLRALWVKLREEVSAVDELEMAVMRMRLRQPDEEAPGEWDFHIRERTEVLVHGPIGKCDFSGRDSFSHIGLYNHKRCCNNRTDRTTRAYSHDQT